MDVNVKVPALEMLMKYTASGVGAVAGPILAPWKARKEAEARLIGAQVEVDSLRLIAEAQAEARRSLVAPDEAGRGTLEIGPDGIAQRIEFQEKKRQANIAAAVRDAAAELGDREVPEHEPDPDWTARFFDCVQDVSSEDMRKLWAKVLSGEVENLGRTSLRTLDILKNLTKKDAQVFRDLCDFAIGEFIFYPNEHQTNRRFFAYQIALHLDTIGLINIGPFLQRVVNFEQDSNSFVTPYQNFILKISRNHGGNKINVPAVILTLPGQELYRTMEHNFRMDYLESFSKFLHKESCELSYARIVNKLPDGSFLGFPFIPIEPEPEQPGAAAS